MSIDHEESPLEQALRSDLPSDATATRMRRRLLAAGIAVGHGAAATTAAAAGAAPGLFAGTATKVGALSWGVKLGFAAAITIPSVGLLAERAQEPRPPTTRPHVAAVAAGSVRKAEPTTVIVPVAQPAAVADAPSKAHAGPSAAVAADARLLAPGTPSVVDRPSQLAFEASEPAAPSKAASTLAEETRILDATFAALAASDRVSAAQLIREHEARFPTGLLERERERAKVRLHEIARGK